MKTLKFYGYSDDTFGEFAETNVDYDTCGEDIAVELIVSDGIKRLSVIGRYGCKPYVMRYEKVYESEYSSFYAVIAAWCNQPAMFSSFPFRLFCKCSGMGKAGYKKYKRDVDGYLRDGGKKYVQWTSMEHIERVFPEIANEYFDLVGCNNKCRNGSERMKDAI